MSTQNNLISGFAGEAKAYIKYLEFAKIAEEEGHPQAAKLFRATAQAKRIYANSYLDMLDAVQTTAENLEKTIADEIHQANEVYPSYIQEAKTENVTTALRIFMLTKSAKKIHTHLYEKALENLNTTENVDYYLCSFCGHIQSVIPVSCPICGMDKKAYRKVD